MFDTIGRFADEALHRLGLACLLVLVYSFMAGYGLFLLLLGGFTTRRFRAPPIWQINIRR